MAGNDGIYIKIMGEIDKAIETALNNIGNAMKTAGDQAADANKKLEKAFDPEMFKKFETEARGVGTRLGTVFDPLFGGMLKGAAAVSAAISGIAAISLKVGGGFEQQMTLVKGVAGATAEEFGKLTSMAESLGSKLPVSASDAARAMYEMASAGMDADEILKAVGDTVNLSISQNYGLAESANILVSTLKIFGQGAESAGKVVDLFNNAANQSMLNMTKLSDSMVYAGPTAHSLGMSLESTVAAMEALSQAGLDGSMIGTGMRQVLSALVSPSAEASKVFAKLGISVYDASGKMRPFAAIMKDIKSSGMEASDAFKAFGDRGATAVQVLAQAADELGRYEAGLRQAGSAQTNVEEQMKTWPNVIKKLTSAIESLELKVFSGIKGSAKALADEITDMVNAFGEWADKTKVVGTIITEFFAGFGIAIPTVDQFKAALDKVDVKALGERFRELAETTSAVVGAFVDLAKSVPWETLLNHLKEIATFIAAGWVASKVFFLISALTGLISVFTGLAGAAGAVSTALSAPVVGLIAILGISAVKAKEAYDEVENLDTALGNLKVTSDGTVESLSKLGEARLKAMIAEMTAEIERMKNKMDESGADERSRLFIGVWEEGLNKAKKALESLKGEQKDAAETLKRNEGLINKFMGSAKGGESNPESSSSPEPAKTRAPSFTEGVSGALKQSISGFASYMATLTTQAQALVSHYGMAASDAATAIKTQLLSAGTTAADELVKQFDNPLLRTLFGSALQKMGEAGKNQLLQEIGLAISGGEVKLKAFQDKMDAFKKANEEFEKQKNTLDEQVASGDARLIATGPDSATYQRKTGMKYGDTPEKNSYEERFNEAIYGDTFTVARPKAPTPEAGIKNLVDPSKTGTSQLEDMLKGAGDKMQGVTSIKDLPGDITKSLEGITTSAETTGQSMGAKLQQGIVDGVKAGVEQAKALMEGLPASIPIKIDTKALSKQLAQDLAQAARG